MKISVGTKNEAKLNAVKEALDSYQMFLDCEVIGVEVSSGVFDQPKSLEETVTGAKTRAKNAFKQEKCDYAIGLESGLANVPGSKCGFMNFCVCAVFDGNEFHLGVSCGFECPKEVSRLVLEEGLNMTEAVGKVGLSDNPKLGSAEGLIGVLTKGRITRKEATKQAIVTALIHVENANDF